MQKGVDLLQIALENGFQADDELQTYQCARQRPDKTLCNTVFTIRVRDWIQVEV